MKKPFVTFEQLKEIVKSTQLLFTYMMKRAFVKMPVD